MDGLYEFNCVYILQYKIILTVLNLSVLVRIAS